MDERLERFVRDRLRRAGQQYERTRQAYTEGKREGDPAGSDTAAAGELPPLETLPTDSDGGYKLVCRRYAEKRAVDADTEGRPDCFEAGHPDCLGCLEDIRDGRIETW